MALGDTARKKRKTKGFGKAKPDVRTLEGLTELGAKQQAEIARKAEKIMAQKKEDPEEIFSGGVISDVFDAMNIFQYGVVGMLKGKSFSEGTKKRESFSDEDALGDYGVPGIVAGIALDIAVDPLTYVGGFGIGKKLFSGLGDVTAVAAKAMREVPAGGKVLDFLGSKFVYRFAQGPEYAALAEGSLKKKYLAIRNIEKLSKPLREIDPNIRDLLTKTIKKGKGKGQVVRRSLSEVREVLSKSGLDIVQQKEVLKSYRNVGKIIDDYTKEYVNLGLLPEDVYKNFNKYIKNQFGFYELGKKPSGWSAKRLRMDLTQTMKRKEISQEVRDQLGQIMDAGYLLPDTAMRMAATVENGTFFRDVASKWTREFATTDEAIAAGFGKLPETKRLGDLAGKFLPKPILDDINEVIRVGDKGIGKQLVAGFKYGKVILNPATHARNMLSNKLLNSFEGLQPYRLDIYGETAKEMVKKGKWYQEAVKEGLGLNTFAAREVKDILLGPDSQGLSRKVKKAMNKVGSLYQGEEEFDKLAQYIFQRKNGLVAEEAWKIAERATFNYSQVTPFIRRLRESVFGFPFITFTYKATPQVIKTAIQYPTRISNIGKIKNAIENLTPVEERRKERAVEPDYIKNGFFIRLPNKDKFGRPGYFDLTYILPFGDIVSGQLFETERVGEPFTQTVLRKFPALNVIAEIARNEDFFGNKIVKGDSIEPAEQGKDIFGYLLKFYAPSLLSGPIETLFDDEVAEEVGGMGLLPGRLGMSFAYEKKKKERPLDVERRSTRTITQELLRAFLGLKVTPFDFERQAATRDRELRERLQKLLIEAGVMAEFTIPFIPKE